MLNQARTIKMASGRWTRLLSFHLPSSNGLYSSVWDGAPLIFLGFIFSPLTFISNTSPFATELITKSDHFFLTPALCWAFRSPSAFWLPVAQVFTSCDIYLGENGLVGQSFLPDTVCLHYLITYRIETKSLQAFHHLLASTCNSHLCKSRTPIFMI